MRNLDSAFAYQEQSRTCQVRASYYLQYLRYSAFWLELVTAVRRAIQTWIAHSSVNEMIRWLRSFKM